MYLSQEAFDRLFEDFEHESLHLEMRDSDGTEAELPQLARWAAGEPDDLRGWAVGAAPCGRARRRANSSGGRWSFPSR